MPALPRRGPDLARDPLGPLLALPGVQDAIDQARAACEELRWHEAFRRRWREVRAEADLRAARASAAVDGARVPLDALRAVATGSSPGVDPASRAGAGADLALAVGALRATVLAAGWRPDLGGRTEPVVPPFAQVVARLHTAAGAGWLPEPELGRLRGAGAPQDLRGLGPAPVGDELAGRLTLLGRTVQDSQAPALVVAAVAHAELLALRPFSAGNGVVARAVFRMLLAGRGLDPTGAVLPEAGWAVAPNPYLAAAGRYATGTPDGVAGWLRTCAGAVREGAAAGREVADAVLAGRLRGVEPDQG
ncbi:MAG TPA: cell filamentation protein Fic [Cellulomonas sp.]